MRWPSCFLRWCLGAAGVAAAGGSVAETPPHPLPDVVVRPERNVLYEPTRESAALDLSAAELPAADLRVLKPATAGDALRFTPSIHTETRGRKYKQLHSFRGQIYPYPDLAFDGIWQREAREVPYVYPAAALDRVEVLRSSSMLFQGLADVVGVIHLVPRRPVPAGEAAPIREAGVEAGSFGTWRAYGLHELRREKSALLTGGQAYRTDGRSGRNAAEELFGFFATHVYQPSADTRIEAGTHVVHGFRELETPDPDGPAMNNLKNRRERYDPLTYGHLRLRGLHRGGEEATTEWAVFLSDRQARYRQQVINPENPPFRNVTADEDDREYGAQVIQALGLTPDNTLRIGLFAHRWTAPDGKQSYVGARQDVASYAVVVADEQHIGRWTLDAGIRLAQSYLYDYTGPAFDVRGTSTRTESVHREWEDPVLTGTVGAAIDLDPRHRLALHVGVGERRPGPAEVRTDGSRPDTERRMTADGGWSLAWGPDANGYLKAGGFLVLRRDAIGRVQETAIDARGQEFYFSGNQDLRQYGIEIEAGAPPFWRDRLTALAGLTWMTSEAREEGGSYERYREVPRLNAFAGLRYDEGDWDAGLYVKHVGRYENFRFAQDRQYHDLGDYVDVTIVTGWRIGRERNWRVYAAADNLLDDRYSTVVGWSDPGIRFRAGAEARF